MFARCIVLEGGECAHEFTSSRGIACGPIDEVAFFASDLADKAIIRPSLSWTCGEGTTLTTRSWPDCFAFYTTIE